ncbi:Peptidoglycan-binding lysin domain [Penicillium digitatum]|uniref:Peptidoglycan-binding lysin domain n=1 Tax=Penicillium digitatum TaxID=36651 RepID=A0A7T6XEF9_PENDI|nr:hypothetical protein PDIDSM_5145 [Penicillium digitatum]QQK39628.1 Peptidoglycan-binding lysin domain [Penicillium digitatum]
MWGISQAKCIALLPVRLATTTLPPDTYLEFPSAMDATSTSTSLSAYTALPVAPGTVSSFTQYERYYNPGANRSNAMNPCVYIAHFIGITIDQLLELDPSLSDTQITTPTPALAPCKRATATVSDD